MDTFQAYHTDIHTPGWQRHAAEQLRERGLVTFSGITGRARLIEIARQRRGGTRMETAGNWRKSSYSGADGGECVEAASTAGTVLVRDTANRDGSALNVPASAWHAFVLALK